MLSYLVAGNPARPLIILVHGVEDFLGGLY